MYCQNCGTTIPDNSAFCPDCGATQNLARTPVSPPVQPGTPAKKNKKGCLAALIIGAIVIVVIIIATSGGKKDGASTQASPNNTTETSTAPSTPANSWDGKFDISNATLTGTSSIDTKITGTLTNLTDREYSYVQIEFNLYDADGAQIGSTLTNLNNLEANGIWKFEAYALEDGVKSFKIKNITAY